MELIVDSQRAVLPALTARLPDGDIGYYQRSQTDCLRAAVATATQTPYADVPDFRDEVELDQWALDGGRRLRRFEREWITKWLAEPRWIAMSPRYPTHANARHTLVMAYNEVYFDPASGWVFYDAGLPAEPTREIEYGLVLEPC